MKRSITQRLLLISVWGLSVCALGTRITVKAASQGAGTDYATLVTAKPMGQKITIAITADGAVSATGLVGKVEADGLYRTYELSAQTVTLSGVITYLDCHANELTSVDVSHCPALTQLYCSENLLTTLDLTKNVNLEKLQIFKNKMQSVDLSKNSKLTDFSASENKFTSIDLSGNPALVDIKVWRNQLVSLDVSSCPNLKTLACHGNNLKTLTLTNTHQMTYLNCDENKLNSLDLSDSERLEQLKCASNQLTSLNITKCAALTHVWVNNNQLTALDVSSCEKLVRIECAQNKLTSLDLTHAAKLAYLVCYSNELAALDVSKCTQLKKISCEDNRISCGNMELLAGGLPQKSGLKGTLYVVTNKEKEACSGEGNIITKIVVALIKDRNWKVCSVTEPGSSESAAYAGRDGNCTDNVLTYVVTLQETVNGSVKLVGADHLDAVPCGTEIKVEVTPDAGYELARMAANDEDITQSKRFVVKSKVLLKAFFAKKTQAEEIAAEATHLYPNPAKEQTQLTGAAPHTEVFLFSIKGTLLQRALTDSDGRVQLKVTALAEGNYPLLFTDAAGQKCISLLTIRH